ncbi:AraC family transcriptional regulator [Paenibacillus qinlingensis]|uniref:AraC-like DNA-binding protein n=1 Tax=Paenibacillus qinlingensis TaxID=1837343 RepID=A0ABU1NS91_9BACL|nr:AraC family transcriptional regulator [Paenibacillus qinlingensis]MDR6550303.1 AraC-like DNA-binding protein [Paenibacillus qinlingensis]
MEHSRSLGPMSLLLPAVNYANIQNAAAGTAYGPRTIPDYQIVYVISGRMNLFIGSEEYEILPGDCAFWGADTLHKLTVHPDMPATFISLHFDWTRMSPEPIHPGPKLKNFHENPPYEPALPYTVEVESYGSVSFPVHFRFLEGERIFHQIVQEYKEEDHGYAMVLRGLLLQVLTQIIRRELDVAFTHSSKRTMISNALQMIKEHPEQAWSITELAKSCGYHHIYFSQLFKEVMGVSPKRYMIHKRIQLAKKLLLKEEKVEVVASKLGYTSIHYFSRHFKSISGMSPSTFRLYGNEVGDL